ncbi:hypothetical protein, partial [Solemya pervernicosa gill symbiont]|uniref:hypothetical protein n=1 Tax=Solemya pervernicosa gill symbiont TaxID=642797 RepID=UPI001F25F46D
SSSSARALNYEYADGVDYRGLTAFASLSMAVSGCIKKARDCRGLFLYHLFHDHLLSRLEPTLCATYATVTAPAMLRWRK